MARKKSSTPKDPFEDLDKEFRDKIPELDEPQIRDIIATVSLNEVHNQMNKANDQDLTDKKEAAKFAAEQYTKATKMNKLRLKYARQVLSDKGKQTERPLPV